MSDVFVKNAWRKVRWVVYSGVFVVLMTACSDDFLDTPSNDYPVAFVSFYHGSPDAPGLSVSVDNRSVFNEIEYAEYSGYMNFYTGNRNFKIRAENSANDLVDTVFTFKPSETYSVFLIDHLSGIEALLVQDTSEVPSDGKAMVRFVHLSPDAASLDVAFDGQDDALFTDQAFKEGSPFKEVPADVTGFDVRAAGNNDALLTVDDLHLKAGKYYTIITRGYKNPPQGNINFFSVQVVTND